MIIIVFTVFLSHSLSHLTNSEVIVYHFPKKLFPGIDSVFRILYRKEIRAKALILDSLLISIECNNAYIMEGKIIT